MNWALRWLLGNLCYKPASVALEQAYFLVAAA